MISENQQGKIKQFYNFINAVKDEENEDGLDEFPKKVPEGNQNKNRNISYKTKFLF